MDKHDKTYWTHHTENPKMMCPAGTHPRANIGGVVFQIKHIVERYAFDAEASSGCNTGFALYIKLFERGAGEYLSSKRYSPA